MRDVLSGAREGKGTVSELSSGRNNFRHAPIRYLISNRL